MNSSFTDFDDCLLCLQVEKHFLFVTKTTSIMVCEWKPVKGCANSFLEDTIVPFSLRNVLVRSAVIHSNGWFKVILEVFHQGLEFLIAIDLADGKSIAVAHPEDMVQSGIELFSGAILKRMSGSII